MVLCSIIDVFKKIADKCVDPIVGYVTTDVGYLINYKANIENLRAEVEDLNDATRSLKDRIEDARNRSGATQVDAVAQRWLERMTHLNEEASRIIRGEERETERCLMGLRPNLWACYLASKSARKVMDDAEELKKDGAKIDTVAHSDYSQCLGVATNPDFEELESRKEASEQIVAFLKDPSVKMVGMYGMGGAGKTTLAEKIGVQLYEDGTFKYVVMSVVSNQQKQDPIYAIQKEIADLLKIELKEKDGLKARAKQLREQLVRKDKLLIILDDIWHRLELRDVGIPVDSSSPQELKVLITSRDLNVMNDMNSKHNVPLDMLTTDDAWKLFDRMANGVAQEDSVLHSTAKDVVKQCGGIPVLLVTIARALRNKGLETWKEALLQLDKFDGDKFVEDGYKRLEVSYNFLPDDEIKSLFLLCAQLIHHSIPIQDLLRYTMGLGFFKGRRKLKEVSPRLHMHLDALKGYCLLHDGKTKGTVRMHDVVYKFAVFIASRDHHMFIVSNEFKEWPLKGQLEQLTAVSLPYCHLPLLDDDDQIPAVLFDTPNLESFLMYGEEVQPKLRIPDNFFKQMTRLKLLVSRRMRLSLLPTSLKDLQTLCLDYCKLDDIAMIGELLMLQVLSLKGSNVAYLPTEIGNLARLKVLDLSECDYLEVIAPGVLSKLTLLEDLRIESEINVWEQEGCTSNGTETASLEELRKLQNLSNLQIHIDDGKMYPKDLIFVNLETFQIGIKCGAPYTFRSSKSLGLDLDNARADQLDQGIKVLIERAENLSLENIKGFTSLCELINSESFPHLKHLHVAGIAEITYIAQQSSCVVFPKLASLVLSNLEKLERICVAQPFKNLSVLKVNGCDRLKDLFSSHMERGFMCLTELNVSSCKGMQTIVSRESENRSVDDDKDQDDKDIEFTQLRSLTLKDLPSLTSFYSNLEPTVEENYERTSPAFLLNKKIMFPRLEELELRWMRADKIWEGQLAVESFQSLTSLTVWSCDKLSYVFSSLMVENLGQLKVLRVEDCDSVEEIVAAVGGEEMTEKKLEALYLRGLKKLKRFCHANLLECPSLKRLVVDDCKELMTFVTNDAIKSSVLFDEKVVFPNLEGLRLENMDQFQMIWGNEHGSIPDSFSKLKTLHIDNCHKIDMQLNGTFAKIFPILDYYSFGRDGFSVTYDNSDGDLLIYHPELFGGGSQVFPVALLQGFQHLKSLVVKSSNLEQVLFRPDLQLINPGDDEDTVAKILARIQSLKLGGLREMTYIWSEDSPLDQILHNLKSLYVKKCDSLISLAPSTALFQNLRHLKLYRCQKLKKLLTSSTARSLFNLIEMTVRECDSLTEIVGDIIDEDAIEDNNDIVFDSLKELKLVALTSLTSFCSAHHCSFKFPSLNSVTVQQCPNMVFFSPGILTVPKLTRVMEKKYKEELWRWEGDLNSTIRQWHRELMTNQDTKELHSTNMKEDCLQQQ